MDNELPAISALRDEETPPPAEPTTFSRFRIKLPRRSNHDISSTKSESLTFKADKSVGSSRFVSQETEEVAPANLEEDELEEDQLIDDDDVSAEPSTVVSHSPSKKSPSKKPRAKKGSKQQDPLFMVSTFELAPNDSRQVKTTEESWAPVQTFVPVTTVQSKPSRRKTAAKKEKLPSSRPRKTKVNQSSAMQQFYDDGGSNSEAIVNTAASSPMVFEGEFPEYDSVPTLPSLPSALAINQESAIDPDNEPVPVWPLPSRNFSVMPAPKIPTGNAPAQPLEPNTSRVRPWRTAQREIRGIGGGRWFVHTWVGEKESEYATAAAALKAEMMASNPTPVPTTVTGVKKFKFLKPDTGERSLAGSGASTPAPVVPDVFVTPNPA